jgi:hypothetical protein
VIALAVCCGYDLKGTFLQELQELIPVLPITKPTEKEPVGPESAISSQQKVQDAQAMRKDVL